MAYQPSLDDLPQDQGYNPSLSDIHEHESNPFSGAEQRLISGIGPSAGMTGTQSMEAQSRGFLAGFMDLARGLANILPHAEEYVGIPKTYEPISQEQMGINKVLPEEMARTPEAQRGKAYADIVPAFTPLGAGGMLTRSGKAFGLGEALAPVYNPDQPIEKSLTEALGPSLAGAVIEPAIAGLKAIPQGAMTLGGKASPAEFERNVMATQGKPVPVTQLSKAPIAGGMEQNILANVPFSGHAQKSMQVGELLDQDVNKVLSDLNKVPEDKPKMRYELNAETGEYNKPVPVKKETQQEKISQNFQENIKKNEKISRELYNKRDEAAKETEGSFLADTRKQIADKNIQAINNEIEEKGFTNVSPETMRELTAASNNNPISFSRLNFNRKTYNDLADQFSRSGNMYEAKIMNELSSGYNSDIKRAINETGNEKLATAQSTADFHFKDKIAPIRNDSKLYAQSKESTSRPNKFLSDMISGGRYDDPTTLDVVLKNLSPEYREQFSHEFLTNGAKKILGKDEVKSDAVLSVYNKLGDETKRLMFSPEHRKILDSGVKTRELMGTGINQMINPKTGYTHAKLLSTGLATALAGGSSALAQSMGMPPLLAYLTGTSGTALLGKGLSEYLTSDLAKSAYRTGSKLREMKPKIPVNISALMQNEKDNE